MRVAFFSTKPYDRQFFDKHAAQFGHEILYLEPRLSPETATLAEGFAGVCAFVNDDLSAPVLERLAAAGTRCIALRCAGFNNVDLEAAQSLGFRVVRVPTYSPHAVAEHSVALVLALNRRLYRSYNRIRDGNFSLDGLLGFDLYGRTIGIVGTGQIGSVVVKIFHGFGCRNLLFDTHPRSECEEWGEYVPWEQLLSESDIITLHCPLLPNTYHLIGREAISRMKRGVMIINTSRGALIDTQAIIAGLKSGHIGNLALDVYEEEANLFFRDLSGAVIQDDVFTRLLTFPNVMITGHQAFFTREALGAIATTTLANLKEFELGQSLANEVTLDRLRS